MDTLQLSLLGYLAAVIGVIGSAYLMDRKKAGWAISIASTILFILYGALEGIDSFVVINIVSIFVSVTALEKWSRSKSGRGSYSIEYKKKR